MVKGGGRGAGQGRTRGEAGGEGGMGSDEMAEGVTGINDTRKSQP